MSDCEGQLSHRLFIFHSNGTCGVPSHRYFMQKARIIYAFNFRSQDDWRSNWWRPTKEGNSGFFFSLNFLLLLFFFSSVILSSRVSHHSKKDSFRELFISDNIHYATSSAGTVLPEWKRIWCSTPPDPVLRAIMYADAEWDKIEEVPWEKKKNSLGEQEGFSLPGLRTEKICKTEKVSKLIMAFLMKLRQIAEQRYFCFFFPDHIPGSNPSADSRFLQHSTRLSTTSTLR